MLALKPRVTEQIILYDTEQKKIIGRISPTRSKNYQWVLGFEAATNIQISRKKKTEELTKKG